jgi:hypothetical protein
MNVGTFRLWVQIGVEEILRVFPGVPQLSFAALHRPYHFRADIDEWGFAADGEVAFD